METHSFKKLLKINVRAPRRSMAAPLILAEKNNIIGKQDSNYITKIRKMRNTVAHSGYEYIKEQTSTALDYIENLLMKELK